MRLYLILMIKTNGGIEQIASKSGYSLDRDHDGDVDIHDFELASRIRSTSDDADYKRELRELADLERDKEHSEKAEQIRELKRLKTNRAQTSELNKLEREESEHLKIQNRSPLKKAAYGVGGFIAGQVQGAAKNLRSHRPRGGSYRQESAAMGRQINRPSTISGLNRQEPAPSRMGDRFNNMSAGMNGFSAGIMGSGAVRNPLGDFSMSLLPRASSQSSAGMKGVDHLAAFNNGLLGGSKSGKKGKKSPVRLI